MPHSLVDDNSKCLQEDATLCLGRSITCPSHSISDTPVKIPAVHHRASIAAAVSPWQFTVETRLKSLRASLLGKAVTYQKLFVYRIIKYNKMGWDCFGTLHKTCTAINVTSSARSAYILATAV